MKQQGLCFDDDEDDDKPESAPYQVHSDTSKAAADEIVDSMPQLRRRVFQYLMAQGELGATDEEMQRALGMNPSTQRPRRVELVSAGCVVDSGGWRKTTAGRKATVWVALQ